MTVITEAGIGGGGGGDFKSLSDSRGIEKPWGPAAGHLASRVSSRVSSLMPCPLGIYLLVHVKASRINMETQVTVTSVRGVCLCCLFVCLFDFADRAPSLVLLISFRNRFL